MKLNYTFSLRDKIIILILSLILVGLVYYYFVDQPVRNGMVEATYQKDEMQNQYDILSMQILNLKRMQSELDEMDLATVSYLESYNANKQEIDFLNNLLAPTIDYDISFNDVTKEGDLIRRPFSLRYSTSSYDEAKRILNKLYNCHNRCLIADEMVSFNYKESIYQVNISAYFYETMVGGIPDAGLPEEQAPATGIDETNIE